MISGKKNIFGKILVVLIVLKTLPLLIRKDRLHNPTPKIHELEVKQAWERVVDRYLSSCAKNKFKKEEVVKAFENDATLQQVSILIRMDGRNMTIDQRFPDHKHGRLSSVKYILNEIIAKRLTVVRPVTFIVILNDGYKTNVPVFGSARHWDSWNCMIPCPLGNTRGMRKRGTEWGTPIRGWDEYVTTKILESHKKYPWENKINKAVFRGRLTMQKYKLGTCNRENSGKCEIAASWREVNRGVLYGEALKHPNVLDVGFTMVPDNNINSTSSFIDTPEVLEQMRFTDFQKYKFVISVGNSEGRFIANSLFKNELLTKCIHVLI